RGGHLLYFLGSASTVVWPHHHLCRCIARIDAERIESPRIAPLRGGTHARSGVLRAPALYFSSVERVLIPIILSERAGVGIDRTEGRGLSRVGLACSARGIR